MQGTHLENMLSFFVIGSIVRVRLNIIISLDTIADQILSSLNLSHS